MGDNSLERKLEDAVWAAHSLFERGKTSGSSANMSFLHEGKIYISRSGSCFGRLSKEDFVALAPDSSLSGRGTPSKELPLHQLYYTKDAEIQAVIHTHGPYAVLWSCRETEQTEDVIPHYTPYLRMKVGQVALVPYAKPGSQALFDAFAASLPRGEAFLLKNHGAIVGGRSIREAFYKLEELEESARIACLIQGLGPCVRIE